MFKKEDNVKYFIGGTALGAAAGLLVGKFLLPNVSTPQSQVFESGISSNHNTRKRSQDDNIYHLLSSQKNTHSHPRSKSASRYEEKQFNKDLSPAIPLEKSLADDPKHDINNFTSSQKSKMDLKNIPCKDKKLLCNTSMEDNVETSLHKRDINLCDKACTNVPLEEKKHFSNKSNLVKSCMNDLSKIGTSLKKLNCENLNISDEENTPTKISKSIQFSEVINDLRGALFIDDSNVINSLRDIQGSEINPYKLKTPIRGFVRDAVDLDNVSNLATFNSIVNFEIDDVGGIYEFQEEELISSTKAE